MVDIDDSTDAYNENYRIQGISLSTFTLSLFLSFVHNNRTIVQSYNRTEPLQVNVAHSTFNVHNNRIEIYLCFYGENVSAWMVAQNTCFVQATKVVPKIKSAQRDELIAKLNRITIINVYKQ